MAIKAEFREDSSKDSVQERLNKKSFYEILGIEKTASVSEVRKAYYKLALKCHPDRSDSRESTEMFKEVGFAYEVLSDEGKRRKYDKFPDMFDENSGDLSRYTDLFTRISVNDIESFKNQYIGSAEELEDIMAVYVRNHGDFPKISEELFFGSVEQEPRYIDIVNRLVSKNILPEFKVDHLEYERSKKQRAKKADKEAREAEAYAKELGLKPKCDESDLTALIRGRQQNRYDEMISGLEAKYGESSSPSLKRIRSDVETSPQSSRDISKSKRIKSNFPAKK